MNRRFYWLISAVCVTVSMVFSGCNKKPDNKGIPFCEYLENGRILKNDNIDYDAFLEPYVKFNSPSSVRPGYVFNFYNYGEDFMIFKNAREDFFVRRYFSFDILGIYQKEDIRDIFIKQSEKYGIYGTCSIIDIEGNYYNQVYITPLSFKYLEDYNSDKSLLLIHFYEEWENLQLFVLFTLGFPDSSIVSFFSNNIETNSESPQFIINSEICTKLRSDNEQKSWEADQELKKIKNFWKL